MSTTEPVTTALLEERTIPDQEVAQCVERSTRWTALMMELIRNVVLVSTVIVVIHVSKREKPKVPLRPWLIVYAVQCVIHMFCALVEFRRYGRAPSVLTSIVRLVNTIFSYVWWVIGLYWVLSARKGLSEDAPSLFWLTIILLVLDVFFIVVGCIVGTSIGCCLIAVLYMFPPQGRVRGDIIARPMIKYKYKRLGETGTPSDGIMVECDTDTPTERALSAESAACTKCFSEYENGDEIYELPCKHHFHCVCIDKWLQTVHHCPVCKYEIPKNGNQNTDQV